MASVIRPAELGAVRRGAASRRRRALLLLCSLWCGWAAVAQAVTVDAFFARVPVRDTGPQARSEAYRLALAQVLTKLSGDPLAVGALAAERGMGPADPLVRQHRYLESPAGDDPLIRQPILEVRFNPTATRERAQQLGLPLWPLERPATLIWVAVERPDRGRSLLGIGEQDQLPLRAVEEAASERALPIVLPLLDIEDQARVRVADVWAGYADRVNQASLRYGAPLLLLGRCYQAGGFWTAHFSLTGDALGVRWTSEAATLEEALAMGVDELANRLGGRLALTTTSSAQRVVVRIFGIEDVSRYGGIVGYLDSLSMVTRSEPLVVAPDHMDFALHSDSGVQGLVQALEFGRVLSRVEDRPPASGVDLLYRVLP